MSLRISIATGSSVPIYRQIAEQIRVSIATGRLEVGDQLPSVRSLAENLVINPNTVARAYGDLVKEGTLESRHGRGAFVARKSTGLTRTERMRRLRPSLEAFLNEAISLEFSDEEIRSELEKELKKTRRGEEKHG